MAARVLCVAVLRAAGSFRQPVGRFLRSGGRFKRQALPIAKSGLACFVIGLANREVVCEGKDLDPRMERLLLRISFIKERLEAIEQLDSSILPSLVNELVSVVETNLQSGLEDVDFLRGILDKPQPAPPSIWPLVFTNSALVWLSTRLLLNWSYVQATVASTTTFVVALSANHFANPKEPDEKGALDAEQVSDAEAELKKLALQLTVVKEDIESKQKLQTNAEKSLREQKLAAEPKEKPELI